MMKRITMPKVWPLARKGKHKYVIVPRGSNENSIALLVVLRDLLGVVKTSREAKKILDRKDVVVNNSSVKELNFPVYPLDIVFISKMGKYFMLGFEGKKFALHEVNASEAKSKVLKVIGKKILKKARVQVNLVQGMNFIIPEKDSSTIKVDDSVLVDLEKNKITKHLPLREKADVLLIGGKHIGETGKITEIEPGRRLVLIDTINGKIKIPKDKILVTG